MSTQEQVFELLQDTGLNWTVNKLPLVGPEGQKTGSNGLFRADTGAWLGTVGPRYVPMQNHTLAETIIEASQAIGLTAKRGGCLRGGSRIYFQVELESVQIGKSPIKRYVTALNSHDGSTSIAFGSTNTVIWCDNTFFKVYQSKDVSRFRHTESAKSRIEFAIAEMKATLESENKMIDSFKIMEKHSATTGALESILKKIIKRAFNVEEKENTSTRRTNQLSMLSEAIKIEFNDQGENLWGLFNGVTRYTNHMAVPKSSNRIDYIMSGTGYKTNLVAFDEIMNWIEGNTVEETPELISL